MRILYSGLLKIRIEINIKNLGNLLKTYYFNSNVVF